MKKKARKRMNKKTKNPYRTFNCEPIKAQKPVKSTEPHADKTVGGDLRVKGAK